MKKITLFLLVTNSLVCSINYIQAMTWRPTPPRKGSQLPYFIRNAHMRHPERRHYPEEPTSILGRAEGISPQGKKTGYPLSRESHNSPFVTPEEYSSLFIPKLRKLLRTNLPRDLAKTTTMNISCEKSIFIVTMTISSCNNLSFEEQAIAIIKDFLILLQNENIHAVAVLSINEIDCHGIINTREYTINPNSI